MSYPWSCCRCWPSGQLREPEKIWIAHKGNSRWRIEKCTFACLRVCVLTCRPRPLSLLSWNFLRAWCPHRPARNTGSPLRAQRQTGKRRRKKEKWQHNEKLFKPFHALSLQGWTTPPLVYCPPLESCLGHNVPLLSTYNSLFPSSQLTMVRKLILVSTTSVLPPLTTGTGKCD